MYVSVSYKLLTLFVSMYSPGASRSLALGPAALSALAPGNGGLLACPPGGPDGQAVVGVRHRFYHAMSARTAACFRGLSGGRTARKGGPKIAGAPRLQSKATGAAGFGAKRPKSAAGEIFFELWAENASVHHVFFVVRSVFFTPAFSGIWGLPRLVLPDFFV